MTESTPPSTRATEGPSPSTRATECPPPLSGTLPGPLRIGELLPALQGALGRFLLAAVLPVLAFYLAFKAAGPVVGIACGMACSLAALAIQLKRLGRLDPIVLVPMVLIAIQGALALLTGSVDLYLAVPAVENIIWGTLLVGSVLVRRPLVHLIAGELNVIPDALSGDPAIRQALNRMTLAWGVGAFVKAVFRLWLLTAVTLEPFLVLVTLFNLAVNGTLLAFSVWLPLRATRRAQPS